MAVKGIVFTIDSIIAFGIIIVMISGLAMFRSEVISPYVTAQRLHVVSEDILGILYNSKLGEIVNQSILSSWMSSGVLDSEDVDKKTVDVIGALWSAGKTAEAGIIIEDVLENFIPTNIGYQVSINGDELYISSNATRPDFGSSYVRISSGRILSGYEKYMPVEGFVARSWATKIKKATTMIVPIELAWGSYADSRYWYNGYAPSGLRANWSVILKNFTLPSDANISKAVMQMAFDNDYTYISINGQQVYYGSSLRGQIIEMNVKSAVKTGSNSVNITFRNRDNDIAHFHPGCYIKIDYNTSESESGKNMTAFGAAWVRGSPAANQIIPFSVNTPISNVTAFVDVKDVNSFLMVTLNYKYNASNPAKNVILYKNYPKAPDCESAESMTDCQATTGCEWNSTPVNYTLFYDSFEGWSDGDCMHNGLWSSCLDTSDSYIRRSTNRANGSYALSLYDWDSDDFPTSEGIFKILDTSQYSNLYLSFWFRTYGLDSGEYGRIDTREGSAAWTNVFTQQPNQDWTQRQIDITSYINASTRIGLHQRSSDTSEYFIVDDFRLIGTRGSCHSNFTEPVKNRSYEIVFNASGTLINEYRDGFMLDSWFISNVTIDNVQNNITNTLGIFADIRPPVNDTVEGTSEADWERLGMFASSDTVYPGDYYSYITDASNVTVYHEVERYGLEYGKIDINAIENFTTEEKNCISVGGVSSCKDAMLNLPGMYPSNILQVRILGTQSWGGNDNGYNYIWSWSNATESAEAHKLMDTDTPPGTFSQIPLQFFDMNSINIIRVGDKDSGRYLNTETSSMMGSLRSIVEYTLLIPSQVGYGDIFSSEEEATEDAEQRLNSTMGSFASATVVQKESFRVGGVPFMYGPFDFRINTWV